MSPEAQRIAIAEARGWTNIHRRQRWRNPGGQEGELIGNPPPDCATAVLLPIPDFLDDLNAMHDAECVLNQQQQRDYIGRLHYESENKNRRHPMDHLGVDFDVAHTTAVERAEALLRTLDRWYDDTKEIAPAGNAP
jgi:hypothetical protein